jgi:hypothetical protein
MAFPRNYVHTAVVALSLLASSISTTASAGDLAMAEQQFNSNLSRLTKPTLVLGGWAGDDSKISEFGVERVTDAEDWTKLWARHSPEISPPTLDFTKVMAIAMFTGSVPTAISRPDLIDVRETDRIDITTKFFISDVLTGDRASHYIIVVLNRSTKPVRVVGRSYALMRDPQEREDLWKEFEGMSTARTR